MKMPMRFWLGGPVVRRVCWRECCGANYDSAEDMGR